MEKAGDDKEDPRRDNTLVYGKPLMPLTPNM
jgi:hypothetical protein